MTITVPRPLVALLLAAVACTVMLAWGAESEAQRDPRSVRPAPSTKPKAYGLLLLNRQRRFPASVIPRVAQARNADRLGDRTLEQLTDGCTPETVDIGRWCIYAGLFPVPGEDAGRTDYVYATRKCAEVGGWLPTADQLLGAADRIKLASTIDDSPLTASIDEDPSDGRKDRREMSSSLVVTRGGSQSSGSTGVSEGATGDPRQGEPDPAPQPADPSPESLHYVTVYDNGNRGGFGGSKPVGQPEAFRCAFPKSNVVVEPAEEPEAGEGSR